MSVPRALLIAAVLAAVPVASGPAASKAAPPKPRGAATKCDEIYARPFTVTRGASKVQLRVMRRPPPRNPAGKPLPPTDQAVFEVPYPVCQGLGAGWRVAVGSFSAAFLTEMKASDSRELTSALAACPVSYRRVDTVCAPCIAGSQHCPCADRDISDWIFCEKP